MADKKPTQKERIAALEEEIARQKAINSELANREESPPPGTALATTGGDSLGVHETATALAAATAKAGIEARFTVALARPRSIDAARVALLKDCHRPSFAEAATFERPVGGGKKAKGPSIRFAEAAARAWGNLGIESHTLYDSDQKRIVSIAVTDLESNIFYGKEITIAKTVERRHLKTDQVALATRTNSTGQTVYIVEATEDDMLAKGNSLESKAIRTGIIRQLPADLVEEGQRACAETLRDRAAKDPDADRKRIIDGFAALGVPVSQLSDFLGHDIGSASPAEMDALRGAYTAVKDGETSWSDLLAQVRANRGDRPGSSGGRAADAKADIAARARGTNGTKPPKSDGNSPNSERNSENVNESGSNVNEPDPSKSGEKPEARTHKPEEGEVAPGDEPTDAELGQPTPESETDAGDDPPAGPPDCPDCGVPMLDSLDSPDHHVCIPCDRYIKKPGK